MEVEQFCEHLDLNAAMVLPAILDEFSAVTDYRTLRDSIPRRLASLLRCRCVLLYQRIGESLQFASGTFDDTPGWSAPLLAIAHINPIDLSSDTPEASAWRFRHAITTPPASTAPKLVAVPLIYRQRAIGVLVATRGNGGSTIHCAPTQVKDSWSRDDVQVLEAVAGVVALLLENTRLLERDRERIHELSLLNSITSQLNCSMYEFERVQSIVIQHAREITAADLCELFLPASAADDESWLRPPLRKMLLARFSGQKEPYVAPLVLERPGDLHNSEYLNYLPANIKTFFAIPLLINGRSLQKYDRGEGRVSGPLARPSQEMGASQAILPLQRGSDRGQKVLGVVVGAYHRAWKLRREELVLLQVLANQASAVLENVYLMTEVIEARNEARKLLRQVLDDQRLKELILESMPSGLITVDFAGNIATFNGAAEFVLGYSPKEVLGQPLQKILDLQLPMDNGNAQLAAPNPQMGANGLSPWHRTESGASISTQTLVTVDRHGQEVMLDLQLVPLHNDQHAQIGTLLTFTDVTSMYRLEEEKRRLDRLASLGEMSASVAHEVRNPLASIKTSMQMLLYDLADDEKESTEARESVSVVLKEVERLDAIVRDLLLFARPRQLHCVSCNLPELSEHVLQIMQAQCAGAGVVVQRVYRDVPLVKVDVAQIEQVLFNLYTNALQAMPDGGVLTVSCQVVFAGTSMQDRKRDRRMSSEFGKSGGGYNEQQDWLELSVSDSGVGIAPDQLERIFQPFFTTKAHGIGLGLPITRRLVEDHRGYMLVESERGCGATISVRLPIGGNSEDGNVGGSVL